MTIHRSATLMIAGLALAACADHPVPTQLPGAPAAFAADRVDRHIVLFQAERVPADFAARVERLGGSIEASLDSLGVSIVTGLSDAAATELAAATDVRAVERDAAMTLEGGADDVLDDAEPSAQLEGAPGAAFADVNTTLSGTSPALAPFYARQWDMRAIHADEAWAAGYRGSRKVRVAIMGGIDYLQPDLVGLVDLEASRSFTPREDAVLAARGRLPFGDLFWHGTAEAGLVATNAKILAGMNSEVTLVAIKVLDSTGVAAVADYIQGVTYAADIGVDILVAYGAGFDKSENPGFIAVIERLYNYAHRRGVFVVASVGDGARDINRLSNQIHCTLANGICGSATAPTSAAGVNGPWANVDAMAPYSNYGFQVDVAAPGGAGPSPFFNRVWLLCTSTPSTGTRTPGSCRNKAVPLMQRIAPGAGVSWVRPHIAGLAALLKAEHPDWGPAQLRAAIMQSADDMGKPGNDPYYGHGRINVARALGITGSTR
jgi:hypothetical protein